jgi:hypothetical protein
MATRRQRIVMFSAGLLVANVLYFMFLPQLLDLIGSTWFSVFVPGEGWAQTDLPEWLGWATQIAAPLVLSFAIAFGVGFYNRGDRLWWAMALVVAAIAPFVAYSLYLVLAFGTCVIDACGV